MRMISGHNYIHNTFYEPVENQKATQRPLSVCKALAGISG